MWKSPGHLAPVNNRQSSCSCSCKPTTTTVWGSTPRITMWLPPIQSYSRHYIHSMATPRKMLWTKAPFVYDFYRPDKGFWHGRPPGPVEYTIKVRLSWQVYQNTEASIWRHGSHSAKQWRLQVWAFYSWNGSIRDGSLHPHSLPFSLQPYSTSSAKSCHRGFQSCIELMADSSTLTGLRPRVKSTAPQLQSYSTRTIMLSPHTPQKTFRAFWMLLPRRTEPWV